MSVVKSPQLEVVKSWLGTGSINFIGMPYAGKDAHAATFAHDTDGAVIGGGAILRESQELGMMPDEDIELMESGDLIRIETYTHMVLSYFRRPEYDGRSLALSSVGRRDGEQQPVLAASIESGHPIKQAVVLDIDYADAYARWEKAQELGDRGVRADDDKKAFNNRFQAFTNHTLPVIDFYVEQGLATRIDGRAPKDEVYETIIDSLAKVAENC